MPVMETEVGTRFERRPPETDKPVVIIATDGTSQSDPAVAFTLALSKRKNVDVRVITVVDCAPVPFGRIDVQLRLDIEEDLKRDTLTTVTHQVTLGGDVNWPIELETGAPAERISGFAAKINASMVVVGLGGHDITARLFGSETALRLTRTSRAPILAVAPNFRSEPRHILVAMDFSEASIEAARLALDLARTNAAIVLAHCVPWSTNEYVPEEWFRSHELAIAAELSRVTRWLDPDRKFRISHRLLYGRVAPTILSWAEEIGADLIVAGSHGRKLLARVLAGQTVSKLIRGARCSVLVLPAAAAFKYSDRNLRDAWRTSDD